MAVLRAPTTAARLRAGTLSRRFRDFAPHGHPDVCLHALRHTVATFLVTDGHLLQPSSASVTPKPAPPCASSATPCLCMTTADCLTRYRRPVSRRFVAGQRQVADEDERPLLPMSDAASVATSGVEPCDDADRVPPRGPAGWPGPARGARAHQRAASTRRCRGRCAACRRPFRRRWRSASPQALVVNHLLQPTDGGSAWRVHG